MFTNGVFDLLHSGHVHVIESARALGDSLIVGLNADLSVRMLDKGPDRPIRSELDRARTIAAFAAVDAVVLFAEVTPYALIRTLAPDILVKGGDYQHDAIVGADIVLARGGRVVTVPLVPNLSTTRIVERLRAPS